MYNGLNIEQFKRFFFYGLDNESDLIKRIILEEIDSATKEGTLCLNSENVLEHDPMEERIKRTILQLVRFVKLNDEDNKDNFFYQKVGIDHQLVEKYYEHNMVYLEMHGILERVIFSNFSAIYVHTLKLNWPEYTKTEELIQYTKQEMYDLLCGKNIDSQWRKENSSWYKEELWHRDDSWLNDLYPLVAYLKELEETDKIAYYSLFLDTKYARAMHRREIGMTQEDRQIDKIKAVYRLFLKAKQVDCTDIQASFGEKITPEIKEYIQKHYPEYETITSLKADALEGKKGEEYRKRVQEEVKKIQEKMVHISIPSENER